MMLRMRVRMFSTITDNVKNYYGSVLQSTKDLKTSACTTSNPPPKIIKDAISLVPDEVISKYYGCGSPLPTAIEGLTVLDLGSGSGRDCYVASKLVGEKGSVIGIDMTDEQIDVAKKHVDEFCKNKLGYKKSNMKFIKGYIEDLKGAGVKENSVDLVISNCVINLSPDKPSVIKGVYDSLRVGGELHFSDVYCDRRLPEEVRKNEVLWGECISGALYIEDFKRICHSVGFRDPRVLEMSPIQINDPALSDIVGNAKFYSITYRCFKIPGLETLCEDYGEVAYYKGTIPGSPHKYMLDDHHILEKGRPMLVCGNTSMMLSESWLKPHFTVIGDRKIHYGLFDCSTPAPKSDKAADPSACAPGGSCC